MSDIRVFDDEALLAKGVAKHTVDQLHQAIDTYGSAIWVLAGGSTPLPIYDLISTQHVDDLDWSKVTVVIGDERIGRLDGPDNNWHAIMQHLGDLPVVKLRPLSDQTAEAAAKNYELQLNSLPKLDNGLPRFDVVWLGIGEDGHTLSLFPGHDSLRPTNDLVVAVHNSPKPPSDRISLSLRALQGAGSATIIVTGENKWQVVEAATRGSGHMPIQLAEDVILTHAGRLTWFVSRAET